MSQDAFLELEKVRDVPCVTVLFPAHDVPEKAEAQDRLRLKNLLKQAEKMLQENAVRRSDREEVLKEAQELLSDDLFWRHGAQGIALFAAQGFFRAYGLAYSPKEQVLVGRNFFLIPSLFVDHDDGWFYILALSQKSVRLLFCSRMQRMKLYERRYEGGMKEALHEDTQEVTRQSHDVSSASGKMSPVFHGHGRMKDEEKQRMSEYVHAVLRDLQPFLAQGKKSVVFAGTETLFGILRRALGSDRIHAEWIHGNADLLREEELHEKGKKIIESDPVHRAVGQMTEERGR